MKKRAFIFIFICFFTCGKQINLFAQDLSRDTIKYFTTATVDQKGSYIIPIPIDTGITVLGVDTLYQLTDKEKEPISYYRKVFKEICFDGNCRLLNVILHWNLTGRYLGFELPPREFLSKAEHTPFVKQEYEQLQGILVDSLSALGEISYENLIPKQKTLPGQIDAVTRPTSKDVLQFVVQGAVFTTYSMWHLIYGQMQDDVVQATEAKLSPGLLLRVLNSPVPWDWMWGLDRLHFFTKPSIALKQRVLEFVVSDSYSLASKAIDRIPVEWCREIDFQKALWLKFDEVEYSLKPNLIQKISESKNMNKTILVELAKKLSKFHGTLLNVSLACLKKHALVYPEVILEIELLAKHKNPYVSAQARKILKEWGCNE